MKFSRISRALSVVLAASYAACGGDAPTQVKKDSVFVAPPAPVVAVVSVTAPARLTVGRTGTVSAVARTSSNADVAGKSFTFTSSNAAAVTVDAAGTLRAIAPGTAVISAAVDGVTGTATVISADASLASLTVSPAASTILLGNTVQLALTAKDSSGAAVALRTTTYTSSNPAVATVSQAGLVTSRAVGTATISVEGITVTAITATSTITVVPVPVASVVIAPVDTILRFRSPRSIVATARDSTGAVLARPITYRTSSVDVAVLDDFGLVTATGEGPVTITATSEGKSSTVRFYVVPDSGLFITTIGGTAGDLATVVADVPSVAVSRTASAVIPTGGVTRFKVPVSVNSSYRVRASSTGDASRVGTDLAQYALLLGAVVTPQPATVAPPSTLFTIPLAPYSATITAPATSPNGAVLSVSWTFDESTQPFSFTPGRLAAARLYYSYDNGADLTGTAVPATVSLDANGRSIFTANFVPPTTGTLFIQVAADGAAAKLLSPIKFLGQAYKTVLIQ